MNIQELENSEHEALYNPQDRFAGFDRGDVAPVRRSPKQTLTVKLAHAELRIAALCTQLDAAGKLQQELYAQLAETRDQLDHAKRLAPRVTLVTPKAKWQRPAWMEAARQAALAGKTVCKAVRV